MAKINNPKDIEYLIFQGGGGKGVAFAGALKALEEKQVLPLVPGQDSSIKGIAGTSAGAITALLVALGYNSEEIDSDFLSKPDLFTAFFDGPDNGSYRTISSFNEPGRSDRSVNIDLNETVEAFIRKSRDMDLQNPIIRTLAVSLLGFLQSSSEFSGLLKEPAHEVLFMLLKGSDTTHHSEAIGGKLSGSLLKHTVILEFLVDQCTRFIFWALAPEEVAEIKNKIAENSYDHIYNLIFDRGLFPGFSIRSFFTKTIENSFKKLFDKDIDGGAINFETFYEYTKCNLIFTGVNVTKNRVQYFSKDHTPNFPVAEAAAISMNIPLVFKPIYVEGGDLEGFWIDGGTVNNLPLHAFDYVEKKELLKQFDEELFVYLHPGALALSLVPYLQGEEPKKNKSWSDELPFLNFLGSVINVMWDPNESQIKREVEREQVIQIPYGSLSTLNFAPDEEIKKDPIEQAYKQVLEYFNF